MAASPALAGDISGFPSDFYWTFDQFEHLCYCIKHAKEAGLEGPGPIHDFLVRVGAIRQHRSAGRQRYWILYISINMTMSGSCLVNSHAMCRRPSGAEGRLGTCI